MLAMKLWDSTLKGTPPSSLHHGRFDILSYLHWGCDHICEGLPVLGLSSIESTSQYLACSRLPAIESCRSGGRWRPS